jgi:hypothetical protein
MPHLENVLLRIVVGHIITIYVYKVNFKSHTKVSNKILLDCVIEQIIRTLAEQTNYGICT